MMILINGLIVVKMSHFCKFYHNLVNRLLGLSKGVVLELKSRSFSINSPLLRGPVEPWATFPLHLFGHGPTERTSMNNPPSEPQYTLDCYQAATLNPLGNVRLLSHKDRRRFEHYRICNPDTLWTWGIC